MEGGAAKQRSGVERHILYSQKHLNHIRVAKAAGPVECSESKLVCGVQMKVLPVHNHIVNSLFGSFNWIIRSGRFLVQDVQKNLHSICPATFASVKKGCWAAKFEQPSRLKSGILTNVSRTSAGDEEAV
mmetsp:Transcript_19946/g.43408  ORF Transcript_19946/g.43408 Transcript_19946/m.43408 type:complete len:129 (-) Transcript_19946:146-532(-)